MGQRGHHHRRAVLGLAKTTWPLRIKHPLNVPVQHSHDPDPREHRRAAQIGHQDQGFHRGPPFLGRSPFVFAFSLSSYKPSNGHERNRISRV